MSLKKGAETAVNICMGVKRGESVLVLTDTEKEPIGQALFDAALAAKAKPLLVKMLPTTRHGEEPPRPVVEMMKRAQVIIAPTKFSITHTQARKVANRLGARIATMPGITEEMMRKGGMTADFKEVKKSMIHVHRYLRGKKLAHLTTPLGTDLKFSLEDRKWITVDTGLCHGKGQYINLPAGELFIPPKEGTAEGKIVIDGAMTKKLTKPVEVTIEKGMAVKNKGGSEVFKALDKQGKLARSVAEFGIGMNPKAKIIGNVLEDEKALGTVHVAFGDNSTFGGKIKCGIHIDGIIMKPTLTLDDRTILEDGKLVV